MVICDLDWVQVNRGWAQAGAATLPVRDSVLFVIFVNNFRETGKLRSKVSLVGSSALEIIKYNAVFTIFNALLHSATIIYTGGKPSQAQRVHHRV